MGIDHAIGFGAAASLTGLLIGIVCGLVPLVLGLRHQFVRPALLGFVVCVFGGFAAGIWGGLMMIVLSTAVVMSYAYVDRKDPFTSRASIDQVSFEESNFDFFIRQMAALGRSTRAASHALVRNKAGFIGFLGLLFFFVMTVFGPLVIDYDGSTHLERRRPNASSLYQEPSREYPLGLDWQGRDVLSHIVYGGKNLILVSVEAGLLTTAVAVILGSVAGLLGGVVDQALSALSNFILTIPSFPLLLVLASIITFDNLTYLALLFAALYWPTLMRAVRAQVFSLRERDYVQAAIALDLGLPHIIFREVLPNMISYIVVNMIFTIRSAMYNLVGLIFLGMVPIQEPDWGVMIYFGRTKGAIFNADAASMLISPIVAIALFQLFLVLFTRSLEEIFNPRLRSGL
ncbi:ABC transporter permease [Aggregatilinea lenta]|uniref:ABC transporter permease n=1 Tax=Aggregatilinea lenta TaxID=913108 RepID=UPI001EE855EF|nr:ABC transporter permease [Aggregatilinea lenta]